MNQRQMLQKRIANYVLEIKKPLGKGANGEVYLGVDLMSQKYVAVKQISTVKKSQKSIDLIQNEINVMKQIKNANVQTQNNMYLVMEYCGQGTLDEYIKAKSPHSEVKKINYLAEEEAKIFLKQIVNGFSDIFRNKIVHRDLKLQNVLIHDGEAKIADFGFSKILEFSMDEPLIKTYAGSPLYMSYQILKEQNYSSKCDIWSLGVMYYEMLFGQPPWLAVSIPDLIFKIENVPIKFPASSKVSQKSCQLIQQMLIKDEVKRIGWEDMFNHDFFKEDNSLFNINAQNDPFKQQNLKQQFYFRSRILQNVKHAETEQKKMNKLLFGQAPQIARQAPQKVTRNRIFDDRKDRSISPKNLTLKNQPSNHQFSTQHTSDTNISNQFNTQQTSNSNATNNDQAFIIFEKNKREEEERKVSQKVSEWLIHKRNKSLFLNYVSTKWYEIYDQGKLKYVPLSFYYSLMFTLFKAQILIFEKMFQQLSSQKLEKYQKCTQQAWQTFLNSKDYQTTLTQMNNDFKVIGEFLGPLQTKLQEAFVQEKQVSNKILFLCQQKQIDKKQMNSILSEVVIRAIQLVSQNVQSTLQQIKQPDHRLNFLAANKDLLIFLTHLRNILNRKTIFKYSQIQSFDFFKYYEDIDNETPQKLAQQIQLI